MVATKKSKTPTDEKKCILNYCRLELKHFSEAQIKSEDFQNKSIFGKAYQVKQLHSVYRHFALLPSILERNAARSCNRFFFLDQTC